MDLLQSVTEALQTARHAEAQQHSNKVRVDGFVVEPADDGSVDIRWAGEAVDPMVSSAGAFFLARYADTLSLAGIQAVLVEGPGSPYLHCPPQ